MENTGFVLVNLQPYREKIKSEKIRQTTILMFFFVFLAGVSLSLIDRSISLKISEQERRNSFISKINSDLDTQIKEISGLKEAIVETLAKRRVVEALQVNRSDGVIILSEVANKLPEGALLKSVKRKGEELLIVGQTQSQSKVSDYMNALRENSLFGEPILNEIKAVDYIDPIGNSKKKEDVVKINEFTLLVPIKNLVSKDEDQKESSKSKANKRKEKN